jgi:hypothetical protein
MTAAASHRLDGLKPANLLAFLALLGLLRALKAADETLFPQRFSRAPAGKIDMPPLRRRLSLARSYL